MATADTNQTINGCKVLFEHPDKDKAKREAFNYRCYLKQVGMNKNKKE